jgi:hypothetical protein
LLKKKKAEKNNKKSNYEAQDPELDMAIKLKDQVRYDVYLGERIHMSQPMNVHIASASDPTHSMNPKHFYCMNVTLTNHGVYLIDDQN